MFYVWEEREKKEGKDRTLSKGLAQSVSKQGALSSAVMDGQYQQYQQYQTFFASGYIGRKLEAVSSSNQESLTMVEKSFKDLAETLSLFTLCIR